MRIWDIPVNLLCDRHLLGEHRELHAIHTFLTTGTGGSYKKHPEVLRWKGKLPALYKRHDEQMQELRNRNFLHNSLLPFPSSGEHIQTDCVDTIVDQIDNIAKKGCKCDVYRIKYELLK
jgi:hypothetical protein